MNYNKELFATTVTDPDVKALKDEREALLNELKKLNEEVRILRSDNEALKELCIRQAMRLMGVNNGC